MFYKMTWNIIYYKNIQRVNANWEHSITLCRALQFEFCFLVGCYDIKIHIFMAYEFFKLN